MSSFLKTEAWKGYTSRKSRKDQTQLQGYSDDLKNSTQTTHDTPIAGSVEYGEMWWKQQEDATDPSIRQHLIDQTTIDQLVIEDEKGDKDATVLRRTTLTKLIIIGLTRTINDKGDGVMTVTARVQKVKWERLTPNGSYAEAEWNPNGL